MKIQISVLAVLLMSTVAYAQEPARQKEVGLLFYGFENFGVTFRTGKISSLWRFSGLNLSGGSQKTTSSNTAIEFASNGFSFSVGKESRRSIAENLVFRFGFDGSFTYSKAESDRDDKTPTNQDFYQKTVTYGPGVNLVVGLNYQVNKSIAIGAELLPSIQYRTGTFTERNNSVETTSDISNLSYGLSSVSAAISLVYQF